MSVHTFLLTGAATCRYRYITDKLKSADISAQLFHISTSHLRFSLQPSSCSFTEVNPGFPETTKSHLGNVRMCQNVKRGHQTAHHLQTCSFNRSLLEVTNVSSVHIMFLTKKSLTLWESQKSLNMETMCVVKRFAFSKLNEKRRMIRTQLTGRTARL